jgi:hypothetical protein
MPSAPAPVRQAKRPTQAPQRSKASRPVLRPGFHSALTAAELVRRARAAALERAVFGLVAGLALASGAFAAWTIAGGPRPYDVRAIVPFTAGPMAWKQGVSPEAPPAPADLDPLVTGSLPDGPPRAATPDAPNRPPVEPAGRGYTLRGVAGGVALIEGPGGLREASPGTVLPGAGRVLSILPAGAGWIVVTSETIIATTGS